MRGARAVVELSDETLMDLYARGDGLAFDELFARYQQRAYAFFLRHTRSEDRAAELYQELFLRLHCAREGYDPVYGARPLRRFIQREVETRIGRALVAGEIRDGATIIVDAEGDQLIVRWRNPEDDAAPAEPATAAA